MMNKKIDTKNFDMRENSVTEESIPTEIERIEALERDVGAFPNPEESDYIGSVRQNIDSLRADVAELNSGLYDLSVVVVMLRAIKERRSAYFKYSFSSMGNNMRTLNESS